MSSNDSTRPEDEGRTVVTDADRAAPSSTPERDADGGSAPDDANGRPSPAPRSAAPTAEARWEGTDAGGPPAPVTSSGSGTAAAGEGPPPWRRVPGEQPAVEDGPERPTVADSLLSEAPTAFLAAPRAASPGPDGGATATVTEEHTDTNGRSGDTGVRSSSRGRPPRQALLQLKRLDPWSVLKMAGALAVVLFLVWMVAAGVLYGVLGGMGVWDRLNGTYADLVTGQTQEAGSLISAGRVFLLAGVVGAINSLLFAVALTIGAFVYNVAADLVGGIEVTLSERD